MKLCINGRFLTQPVSGVQRYAWEVLTALDRLLPGPVDVLVPRPVPDPGWQNLRPRVVPGARGHLWEQGPLWRASRDAMLLSLGNVGPLRHRAHILCLHDAHIYEIPEAFSPAYRLLHRSLRPPLARRASALITVSRHSAQALSGHLGVAADRFDIVPNAADHLMRLPTSPVVPALYGLIPGGYLLTVGNQSPNKNIGALVEAHRAAGAGLPELAVVGGAVPGVARSGAAPGVRFLGRVPDADLRGLYEGAAGFVFPSLHEGFGIPPLEAMSLGVPTLCARSGAMPEVLGDGPLWFDPRDPRDMTAILRRFASMAPAERQDLKDRGRAVAARYTWATSAELLLDILIRVAGQDRRVA